MPIGGCRAIVSMPHVSGVSEDTDVNVWHFGGGPGFIGAMNGGLAAFYANNPTGHMLSVTDYFSPAIDRSFGAVTVKWYDLTDPTPRVPFFIDQYTFQAPSVSTPLPAEVAVCVSYKGSAGSGVNPRRNRGRIYLGPLNIDAIANSGPPNSEAIVNPDFAQLVVDAFGEFLIPADVAVYSRADDALRLVTDWYVDEALDTQRRRGIRSTSRTIGT